MRYEKFIEYVLNGHEFMGFVCSHELKNIKCYRRMCYSNNR